MNIQMSGVFEAFRIVTSDDGNMCHPWCPQMVEGRCNRFSGTLLEKETASDIFARTGEKVRWQACHQGTDDFINHVKTKC